MSKKTGLANTPCYVLKSGNQSIYPTIYFDDPGTNCICVYGFSAKPKYDKFIESARQLLTPYPLVAGYLSNQIDQIDSVGSNGDWPGLVILDATDLEQPLLSAATMAAVLLAQQEKAEQVSIEFELEFDPERAGYFIKKGAQKLLPHEAQKIPNAF